MRQLQFIFFLVLLLTATPTAFADKDLQKAARYFRADKQANFKTIAAKFDQNSVYFPLIRYWSAVLDLRRNRPDAAVAELKDGQSPYLRKQLREQLLTHYINAKEWQNFSRHAGLGGPCARALQALITEQADARAAVRDLWKNDAKLRDKICIRLYQTAKRRRVIGDNDIWIKLRSLAGRKQLSASRRLLAAFPGYIRYQTVRKVVNRSVRYIRGKHGLANRAQRELVMMAAMAAVRSKPDTAIRRWRAFSRYFSAEENAHVWTVLAEWAARWHRDDALALARRGDDIYADDNTRAWRVRAALRAGDAEQVWNIIEAMPMEQRQVSAWRYWRAVAAEQLGRKDEAVGSLDALAKDEDDFYGLLARDALGQTLVHSAPPPPPRQPDGDLALALALYTADEKKLARRIWRGTISHTAAEKNLLAAAQQAAQHGWNLASINAANKVRAAHAHHLRFPLPYRDVILKYSGRFQLDPAFVFGLIRQESRFMPSIVSSAKARGLMQVIPRTAKSVARKHGYGKYRLSRLTRVDTNVIIGTTYLADLADELGGRPTHIAAAYNAGPGRVRRWYRASPGLLAAIENIPLTETRLYVKHILANRLHYIARLGERELPSMEDVISRPIRTAVTTTLPSSPPVALWRRQASPTAQ